MACSRVSGAFQSSPQRGWSQHTWMLLSGGRRRESLLAAAEVVVDGDIFEGGWVY